MRYLLFLLPLYLLSTPFKVATYNVENLFDATVQGTEYEEYIPGKHNWNRRMMEIKLNHTAEVLCDMDADIVGLQEIENSTILQQLLRKLNRVGCGYQYSAITTKKSAPIQVALLSRYPIIKKADIEVSYAPRVRNILEVEVSIDGTPLTLFVNHWKSKAYQGYESKRIMYAKALQQRIVKLDPYKAYIILGDLNSDYNAYLTLEDRLNDSDGLTAFNDILQTKRGNHLVDKVEILSAKRGVHYSLWNELPLSQRWSHKFYGKNSSLDHIVLPKEMFDGRGIDYVNHSFKVFKAEYLFTKRGYINSWRYKHGKHLAKGYSDHLPLYAYFDNKPYVRKREEEKKQTLFHQIKTKSIAYLYERRALTSQIKLENVVVLFKRGRSALIKQKVHGRGIYLFGCAAKMKEGHSYDVLVDDMKSYHGLKEITSAYIVAEKEAVSLEPYYARVSRDMKQNEILRDIVGIYQNRKFLIGDKKIPIYFKKKRSTPPNGSKLKLYYVQLGYYNHLQLVVHSPKDFVILEK